MPLDVYLGNLGPLRHRVYQTNPPGPSATVSPFVQSLNVPQALDSVGSPVEHSSTIGPTPVAPALPAPPRYIRSGPMHTIVVVEMPPLADVLKALEADALPPNNDVVAGNEQDGTGTGDPVTGSRSPLHGNGSGVPPTSIAGRSLPLLFIRASDGVGYHSGRTIACENVFQSMDLGLAGNAGTTNGGHIDTGWLAAAQAAAAVTDGGLHGWTLRVM